MKLLTTIDRDSLNRAPCLAESSEFAIYDLGEDTYALVQRHQGVPWQGVSLSGDALFRVAELLTGATRRLYRDVAAQLSPKHRIAK